MTSTAAALRVLIQPGSVAELRILNAGPKRTVSGYFNDMSKMAAAADRWSGRVPAVYTTLNPVVPDLLARANNRLIENARSTTTDRDIVRRIWLPIDFDVMRPAGISSTAEEHEAALSQARRCREFLRERGWPDPIYADSGNGAHLDYRIDLPTESTLVQRVLEVLAREFDDTAVHVDTGMHNPSRIWKLYGTKACKGDSTPSRPHRMSAIIECPSELIVVTPTQLEDLIGPEPAKAKPPRPYEVHCFDVEAWLTEHQDRLPPLGIKRPLNGSGWKREFEHCPWNPDHTNNSAYIGQLSSGAIVAGCHHNSCGSKTWHDLKAVVGDIVTGNRSAHVSKTNGHAIAKQEEELVIASAVLGERADMPESVLDGKLGEICQRRLRDSCVAYAWPSLVVVAGASPFLKFVGNPLRSNLFACLVGPVDTGKSATSDHCLHVLGMGPSDPILLPAKFGSGEALMQELDRSGPCVRLLYPDELKHLLVKAGMEGASFPTLLTTAYYHDEQRGGTKKNKEQFKIDCRLSITGGVVEDDFEECFGSASVSGLYDRFIFGLCPAPYRYLWRPNEGVPESIPCIAPNVAQDVWDERNQWIEDGISPRVAEHCLRVAYICAAVDRRQELRASQLGPALAMAKYQVKFRSVMRPNTGQNPIAQCANSVRTWLEQHNPGEWVRRHDLSRGIHSDRLGPMVFNQTLTQLAMNDEIEVDPKRRIVRLSPEMVVTVGDKTSKKQTSPTFTREREREVF
ncbi:MAG: hypothetical protein ACLPTQ_16900 [Terriglobales bacterium]